MRNIKLILEYDGTNYHGWQTQSGTGRRTIQETLEQSLKTLTNEELVTYSSGRTDAGVHALGHVANFKTKSGIPSKAWAPALNRLLPPDIRVLLSEDVPMDFHARYSASGKIYTYRILYRQAPSALHRNYAWHIDRRLKLNTMRLAARVFIGTHDFSSFRSSGCGAKTPVRTVKSLVISKKGDFIDLLIEADAFLMHMARNIVGTLVEVGFGRFSVPDVDHILLVRDRKAAGRTAPAHGLCLLEVFYPKV